MLSWVTWSNPGLKKANSLKHRPSDGFSWRTFVELSELYQCHILVLWRHYLQQEDRETFSTCIFWNIGPQTERQPQLFCVWLDCTSDAVFILAICYGSNLSVTTRWNQGQYVPEHFIVQLLLWVVSHVLSGCCGDKFEKSSFPPGYFSLGWSSLLCDPWIQNCFRPEFQC